MTPRYRFIITPKNLRSAVAGLPTGKTLDHLYTFLSIINDNARNNLNYFNENEELSKVLFTETFPSLIDYFISQQMYLNIISIMPTFVHLCNYMSYIRKFSFLPFMVNFFGIAKSLSMHDSYIYVQYQYKYVKKSANLNIFHKILIDLIVRQKIIQVLINDFLFHQSFDEIKDYFDVFNQVFPFVEKSVLLNYEEEFSRFSYSVDDQRFDNPISVKLTRAMAECSSKYAQLHFDNIIKFLMSDFDDEIKGEFIDLIKNPENLKCIQNSLLEMIDFILAAMREDEEKLREISSILISNNICDVNLFIEKAGNDIFFNVAFFDLFKENYTTEYVESIINSEEFCEQTAEFGFKIINYKIDLISNLSSFLQKCYSSFWNEYRMNEIVTLSRNEKNRKILLDSINNFEIENYKIYKIVCEILILLKPSTDEFNYNHFVDKVLYYTDSILLVPFLTINSFIPANLIDVEDLISFSVFNEQLSDFLLDHFSDDLINHIEFFLELQIDDEIENKCLSKFLFNLYKKNNSNENNRLIWESVIRSQDKDEEIHSFAQKIINENPSSSQKEIFEKIENGYSNFFINFDFSNFDESSAEENGNYLFFGKPKLVSADSFFYLPSKICHALNHNEKIEESEIKELFEFQIGDIGIDAVLLNMSFDAAMKLNIEFTPIKQSLDIAFQLKYKKFVKKLLQYIIDSSNEVVQIDDELINSFAEIDANYAVELIKKKNVIEPIINLLYIKYQTFPALSILRKTENKIQVELLDNIIYSKLDIIDFIKSNRIDENRILPFIFSINFPQFYRTKFLMNFLFQRIESNPQLLLNFLTSLKIEKKSKFVKQNHNFIPFIDSKFYSAYFSFALSIPDFYNFPKPKFAAFLSNLIYEKEGEENQNIVSPIKEPIDDNQKVKASRKLFYQFLDIIISELPNGILKNFELRYSTKNSLSLSESKVFHDYSLFINSELISEDLKKYFFINQPKILLFKIQKLTEFQIEENIFINKKRYSLSCIGTKTSVYIPHKSNKKYVKYSNGDKSYTDFIEGKVIFIFYQLIDDTNDYEILKNRFKKFKSSEFNFNKRAIICDSLNKAGIEWKNWKKDEILFNIAKILMSEIGYTELFKELSDNQAFSEFFFKSDWKEKYSLFDINKEMIRLANIYPNKEELIKILINSLKEDDQKHFSSIILNSFDLNDETIQEVIKNISPVYDDCKDLIVNYFLKKTTSNELLQNNENLAKFVLSEIEKIYSNKIEWETIKSLEMIPYNHLLSPMTESLFITFTKTLNKTTNDLILQSFGNSPSTIAHSLSILPHGDKLVSLFCGIKTNEEAAKELRNDLEWVTYSLSSLNEQIRKHSIDLIKYVFKSDEGFLLSVQLREAILRSLLYPYVNEVVFFILDYFGYKCIDSSEFVSEIYDKIFSVSIPVEYQSIESLFNILSPPLPSSIIKWHYVIKNIKHDETTFLVYSSDLLYAAIKSGFKPPFVGFLEDIITPLYLEISIDTFKFYFNFMQDQIDKNGLFDTIKIILEFEVTVFEYIIFISNLLLNYSDFRETETIILALYLPSVVLKRRELIKKNKINEKRVMVDAIEKATTALSFILKKDNKYFGFIRKSGIKEIDELMANYYYNSYLNFFSADFLVAIDLLADPNNSTKEYKISSLKKLLKFVTFSSLAFRDVLKIMFDLISKTPGLRIFNDLLSSIELEWCELCCEIAREILSDIQFKDQIKQAVSIVDRELCTQLYHFNMAEKGYLKFLTAVMKNDHLRIQSGLQCNTQIFNVLRNNFVFCIDDVTAFIDISIDKYSDFFNADDIKNFILKLQINDNQIKQKLKIVSILFDKCSEKMKPLIEEIFPKIEELSSTESSNDEISELINQVLEQALVVLSLID